MAIQHKGVGMCRQTDRYIQTDLNAAIYIRVAPRLENARDLMETEIFYRKLGGDLDFLSNSGWRPRFSIET